MLAKALHEIFFGLFNVFFLFVSPRHQTGMSSVDTFSNFWVPGLPSVGLQLQMVGLYLLPIPKRKFRPVLGARGQGAVVHITIVVGDTLVF